MFLPILNKDLQANVANPTLFLFPPVRVPYSSSGTLGSTPIGGESHYASIVYDLKNRRLAIMEYSLKIFHALATYNRRHERLADLEILLSRHEDGRIKMNIGNTSKHTMPLSYSEIEDARITYHNKLIEQYKAVKNNHKLNDL